MATQRDPIPGPPWDRDFLADLHAGVYPDDPELLARVYADPEAVRFLDALERVSATLRAIGRSEHFD